MSVICCWEESVVAKSLQWAAHGLSNGANTSLGKTHHHPLPASTPCNTVVPGIWVGMPQGAHGWNDNSATPVWQAPFTPPKSPRPSPLWYGYPTQRWNYFVSKGKDVLSSKQSRNNSSAEKQPIFKLGTAQIFLSPHIKALCWSPVWLLLLGTNRSAFYYYYLLVIIC